MPHEIRSPLLAVGNELLLAGFRAFRTGRLDTADLKTVNHCAGLLTKAVEARGENRARLLGDVIADLSALRDQHGEQLPEIGRVINVAS